MGDIAYQNKDIAAKVTGEAMVGRSLAPFGRPDLKIVSALPTNLPTIESNELRLDHLFLLSDGSLSIIDYESEFNRENFVKYINYFARVIKRYANQQKLGELKRIKMVVIYTADVEHADCVYDLDGLVLNVEAAYLVHLDTDQIYCKLSKKIQQNERLTEEELMELMVLPLTVKGKPGKQEVIVKAVELAKKIPDRMQTLQVLAGILTFTDKVIDETYRDRVKEEMQMTRIGQMIFEDGLEQGLEQGTKKGIQVLLKTYKDLGVSRQDALVRIIQEFSLSEEAAHAYLNEFW